MCHGHILQPNLHIYYSYMYTHRYVLEMTQTAYACGVHIIILPKPLKHRGCPGDGQACKDRAKGLQAICHTMPLALTNRPQKPISLQLWNRADYVAYAAIRVHVAANE